MWGPEAVLRISVHYWVQHLWLDHGLNIIIEVIATQFSGTNTWSRIFGPQAVTRIDQDAGGGVGTLNLFICLLLRKQWLYQDFSEILPNGLISRHKLIPFWLKYNHFLLSELVSCCVAIDHLFSHWLTGSPAPSWPHRLTALAQRLSKTYPEIRASELEWTWKRGDPDEKGHTRDRPRCGNHVDLCSCEQRSNSRAGSWNSVGL